MADTWSPFPLFAHGFWFSLGVCLHQPHNVLLMAIRATMPRLVDKGVVGHPAWRLQCRLSRQVPGGVPGSYTRLGGSGTAGIGAQCSFAGNPQNMPSSGSLPAGV